jgi:hypothetical protein
MRIPIPVVALLLARASASAGASANAAANASVTPTCFVGVCEPWARNAAELCQMWLLALPARPGASCYARIQPCTGNDTTTTLNCVSGFNQSAFIQFGAAGGACISSPDRLCCAAPRCNTAAAWQAHAHAHAHGATPRPRPHPQKRRRRCKRKGKRCFR